MPTATTKLGQSKIGQQAAHAVSASVRNTMENLIRRISYKSRDVLEDSIRILPTQFLSQDEIEKEQCYLRNLRNRKPLLAPKAPEDADKITLVLDLDETLIHSSLQMLPDTSCVLPVIVDGVRHMIYGVVRPGAFEFLKLMGSLFEIIVYTASLEAYAHAMVRFLDRDNVVRHILCRNSCFNPATNSLLDPRGGAIKDLSLLQRPLEKLILIDNSPHVASLQPENAIIVKDFLGRIDDMSDTELERLMPFLASLANASDTRPILKTWGTYNLTMSVPPVSEQSKSSVSSERQFSTNNRIHRPRAWQRAWHGLREVPNKSFFPKLGTNSVPVTFPDSEGVISEEPRAPKIIPVRMFPSSSFGSEDSSLFQNSGPQEQAPFTPKLSQLGLYSEFD